MCRAASPMMVRFATTALIDFASAQNSWAVIPATNCSTSAIASSISSMRVCQRLGDTYGLALHPMANRRTKAGGRAHIDATAQQLLEKRL